MSRIRTVKPELFKHEELFDAELDSGLPLRLAFIGLFTVADCEGRFKWRPRTLKLEVLPHDTVDFAQVLQALEQSGFIQSYSVDGERYGWIPNFKKHQRLQTKELAAGSELPAPCLQDQHGTNQERTQVRTGTHPEAQEGKGREEEGKKKRRKRLSRRRHRQRHRCQRHRCRNRNRQPQNQHPHQPRKRQGNPSPSKRPSLLTGCQPRPPMPCWRSTACPAPSLRTASTSSGCTGGNAANPVSVGKPPS